ncbi:L-lysine 2,3-aminomutase [Nitratireductor indicus C115]|uniref:L-lysine 2,3-aminomutase n=1 Tax=Nitratireductor indicus C115 TaxID=1231190 RepID=K2PHI4_9HYPH|nr:lysine 2,3-aminomutase [Nitratireductor indicus]EKF40582.1 L-lysine 2,3-aminomutase [Nitratireductor indicus C115]SFQ48845.1 KamA family protein [Nitratireductor indicus]
MLRSITQYRPVTAKKLTELRYWDNLSVDYRKTFLVASEVLPFRVNEYVLENFIDWSAPEDDPMFRLLFPQEGMLTRSQFARIEAAQNATSTDLREAVRVTREELNPHPAGQMTDNIPTLGEDILDGIQHKYAETALFFPSAGQTCHAYCSFCFRWPQFVGEPAWKIQAREAAQAVSYLRCHQEITDILITGGDPLIMNSKNLRRYVEPFLAVESLKTIRFGSKAVTYWPHRFLAGEDAADLLSLFEEIVASGKSLAFMAHLTHSRELEPPEVKAAINAIRATGATIRTQAPLLKHVNDDPVVWAKLWTDCSALGIYPYYMFVERDTGPSGYFRVPLWRAHEIYSSAISRVSGLSRTARGPVMSSHPGKVVIDGIVEVHGQRALSLRFLQAREPTFVGRVFLAEFDETASWLDDLRPLGGGEFFFEARGKPTEPAAPQWTAPERIMGGVHA